MSQFNPSYIGKRNDILHLLPENVSHVLDVGCSIGTLGEQIKITKGSETEVVGIELNAQMAEASKKKLNTVIVGNIEEINLNNLLPADYFDCIIFADILEHLRNPWEILNSMSSFLNSEGVIIASIPNVRYYTTIFNLIAKGYWPYRERGIHDKTHLRFFTLKNIQELFQYANLSIENIIRNYRIIDSAHQLNNFSKYFSIYPLKEFITFQYLIVAKKKQLNVDS